MMGTWLRTWQCHQGERSKRHRAVRGDTMPQHPWSLPAARSSSGRVFFLLALPRNEVFFPRARCLLSGFLSGLTPLSTHAPDPAALAAVCTHGNVRGTAAAKGCVAPSSSSSAIPALVKWGLEARGGHRWWGTGW